MLEHGNLGPLPQEATAVQLLPVLLRDCPLHPIYYSAAPLGDGKARPCAQRCAFSFPRDLET